MAASTDGTAEHRALLVTTALGTALEHIIISVSLCRMGEAQPYLHSVTTGQRHDTRYGARRRRAARCARFGQRSARLRCTR